ncbi:asparagine synthetase B family protein [Bradyrhizobium sp. HKCCYLS20291]|uniref:asparagine synthetase B family protein n=1 Tax=Bradyrhizobium sp. HKCCYLS20291 TaxID=3420766 RepID=UPI003EB85C96
MTIAGAIGSVDGIPDVARALRAMALGPGKPRLHRDGGLELGVCDEAELVSDGRIVALFHGRLDDATEFGKPNAARSAATILIQAYRRWDTNFARELFGDFACAVWDGERQLLLLARDALGAQPLHYWCAYQQILFATEPRGLLTHDEVAREIDPRWVARWLALLPQDDATTLHRGIARVLPGHVAVFAHGKVEQRRYWRPEELAPIRLPRDQDYADGVRELLDEAIRCRIAGARSVGSQLSAGLDSSSVTTLAARQLADCGQRLTAFTAVPGDGFDGHGIPRNRIWNEGPLASVVAAAHPNIDHVLVPNEGDLFDALDQVDGGAGLPARAPSNQVWIDAIGRAARQRGVTVLLTGAMGNMSVSYDGIGFLTHLARSGRWITLARHLSALHRRGKSWAMLGNRVVAPLLPTRLRRPLRQWLRRPEPVLSQFSAMSSAFAAEHGVLAEALTMSGDVGATALGESEVRLAVFGRLDRALPLRGARRRFGITTLDPTADRRVIEFCLAIPPEQFLLGGEDRSLIRRAMRGVLPDAVRLERRRGMQSADWPRHLTAARAEIEAEIARLQNSPLASACLDLPRLRRLLDHWPKDGAPGAGWHDVEVTYEYQLALLRGLATGRFLRRFEGGNE